MAATVGRSHFLMKTTDNGGIHWLEFRVLSPEVIEVTSGFCLEVEEAKPRAVTEARKIWNGFKTLGYQQISTRPVRAQP